MAGSQGRRGEGYHKVLGVEVAKFRIPMDRRMQVSLSLSLSFYLSLSLTRVIKNDTVSSGAISTMCNGVLLLF